MMVDVHKKDDEGLDYNLATGKRRGMDGDQ